MSTITRPISRLICRLISRPTHLDRYIDRYIIYVISVDMSVDISTDTPRSIYRPIYHICHFLYRTRSSLFCHAILTINQRRLAFDFCQLFQNNMRGKFTRGNPQDFQHQISSHSETQQIRRASSSSSIIMERNA